MNPTAQQPAPTLTPAPTIATTSAQTPGPSKKNLIIYPIALVCLILGVVLGYFLFNTLPGNKTSQPQTATLASTEIKLPSDAVQIQACSDHRGALYVKPADIPTGPVYMVYNGKVIGIEYMLGKEDFLGGKSYKDLAAEGVKVDHVNVGLLSQGHVGYPIPHYHVDMYTVSQAVEESIVCPAASNSASSSASLAPTTASQSATTSASAKSK